MGAWMIFLGAALFAWNLGVAWLVIRGIRRIPRLECRSVDGEGFIPTAAASNHADSANCLEPRPATRPTPNGESQPTPDLGVLPRVSIVVPARNEARHVEAAARTLLALDYPDLEVVMVNDRSTDDSGRILDSLAQRDARLTVVHLSELPAGWLGKNYALAMGAARATGDFLLFADADVSMSPQSLRLAVGYLLDHRLDHLALTPGLVMPGWWLKAFVTTFVTMFSVYFQPWKASDPRSPRYVGIGAFNLIRRNVYEQIGTHHVIRMRPDDDMMLGKLIKRRGYRQAVAQGAGLISVPWYESMGDVFVGLEKNAFAGVDYHIGTVIVGGMAALLLNVWPFLALFVTSGVSWWLHLGASLALWALATRVAIWSGLPWHTALSYPACVVLFLVIQWRATILALWNYGIRWRDTYYPLEELKANRVI